MPRIELTDRFVAGAKSNGANQIDYFDAKSPGLSLRCSRTRKAWSFIYTSPASGKRARLSLGSYPAVSLRKREAWRLRRVGGSRMAAIHAGKPCRARPSLPSRI